VTMTYVWCGSESTVAVARVWRMISSNRDGEGCATQPARPADAQVLTAVARIPGYAGPIGWRVEWSWVLVPGVERPPGGERGAVAAAQARFVTAGDSLG
jgi:hypothetical protein